MSSVDKFAQIINYFYSDWIIVFEPDTKDKQSSIQSFDLLIHRLLNSGLHLKTRKFTETALAIYIHCPKPILAREAYKNQVEDWLNNVGEHIEPPVFLTDENIDEVVGYLKPAEKLRVIYDLLTTPTYKGGIGLQVGVNCKDIFAPQDLEFNKSWISSWNKKFLLSDGDLSLIRDYLGERTAYYFAFLQYYFLSLSVPTVLGLLVEKYSILYGCFMILYAVIFVILWTRREKIWAIKWRTRNLNNADKLHPEFKHTKLDVDPITNEISPYYPSWRRIAKIVFISSPVLIISALFISFFVLVNLSIEVFVHEYYKGPFKAIAPLIPTICYSASIPTFNAFYSKMMIKLNLFENRPTEREYHASLTQKTFLVLSLVGFLNLFLVGFGFIPFHDLVQKWLSEHGLISSASSIREIGPHIFTERLVYFVVTGQIVNAFTELGLPFLRGNAEKYISKENLVELTEEDARLDKEEIDFLKRVRKEFEMPEYDDFNDYVEMITQFGYLVLFSVAWPPTALACFINNFLELRSDAIKIAKYTRRPIPTRSESIGPWKNNIHLICWLSTFSVTSLIILFRDWDSSIPSSEQTLNKMGRLTFFLILNEKIFFAVKKTLTFLIDMVPIKGGFGESLKRRKYILKKDLLGEAGLYMGMGELNGDVRWHGSVEDEGKIVMQGVSLKEIHNLLSSIEKKKKNDEKLNKSALLHFSTLNNQDHNSDKRPQSKTNQKEESVVEKTIRTLKENTEQELPVSPNTSQQVSAQPPKPPLLQRIKAEVLHFWDGLKLLAAETGISSRLLLKLGRGNKLSRREMNQLRRSMGDLLKLVPFIIIVLIPFMEFALPLLIKVFPNMLPSTFESKYQEEEKKKKLLKIRLEVAKFLQDTVGEMAVAGQSKTHNAKEFVDFFHNYRASGEQAPTEEIIKIAKKFEDRLTLNSLSRPQLISMCRYMNINAFGTDPYLRQLIVNRLDELKADDQLILSEGVDNLTVQELQTACQARGIRVIGASPARLRSDLHQWIELNLNQKIPSSLLILSRAFIISERIPTDNEEALKVSAQSLQATLSSLPDQVVNEAALKVAESEGSATYKQKLDVLKEQEELLDDELEQEAVQAAIKKAKETEAERLEKEKEATKVPMEPESAGVYYSATEPEIEFPEDKINEEDLKKEIKKIAEVLKTTTSDSALSDVKAKLDSLKEDRKGLTEGLEELQGLNHQPTSKSTQRLSTKLDKMISKIEQELLKYDSEIGSKLHLLKPNEEGKLSITELEDCLKVIRQNPNDERIKKIVKNLDFDGDGYVTLDEIRNLVEDEEKNEGSGVNLDKDGNKKENTVASPTSSTTSSSGAQPVHVIVEGSKASESKPESKQ
ncbi:hypothetical protein HDU92_001783 [Lobulomyces angularis]|nr:hypothetical protein HDU92_001783 [Lobulomyces angularis]